VTIHQYLAVSEGGAQLRPGPDAFDLPFDLAN